VEWVHGSWTGGAPGSTVDRGGADRGSGGASPVRRHWSSPVMEEDEPVEAVLGRCSPVPGQWRRGSRPEAVNVGGLSNGSGRHLGVWSWVARGVSGGGGGTAGGVSP
jgi:hypothetical protein